MAAPMLLRGIPRLRFRLQLRTSADFFTTVGRPSFCSAIEPSQPHDGETPGTRSAKGKDPPKFAPGENPNFKKLKDREAEILRDIEPITSLAKEILHSNRYVDGERLTAEDEKAVVEKLLVYHPHFEDKIGCGIDSIMVVALLRRGGRLWGAAMTSKEMLGAAGKPGKGMGLRNYARDSDWASVQSVDRHPQFRKTRCLFVVRTDGGWIDFSYLKCLRAYIRDKYPSHAERLIREHIKSSSSN
ncbi:hypothetical protein HHK36_002640 [Tetracentron sinense]|uniref:DCL protein n=1 Tax=Tetracentron sinense TaxID=13715 RepID=A0A835DN23_TETSI|nr:hypothetical protein HHK36_002640 [Tetracentron sinense]